MIATIGFILVIAAAAAQVVSLFRKGDKKESLSPWLMAAAAAAFLGVMLSRSVKIGFIALTSTYESLLFYSAFIMILDIVYRFQKKIHYSRIIGFGATIAALVLAAIASSPLLPKEA
ncbi:MAG: cytochrome C biogenesis protein, partial [Spirochaetales bacterium]|nr:cytochrome C biogenesis protein [Spirochaetales bacterium]